MENLNVEMLDQLLQVLDTAKQEETEARSRRIDLENRVIDMIGAKEEGTQTTRAIHYQVKVTGKLTRRVDWQAYDQVTSRISLPANMLPVRLSRDLDLKKLKIIERDYPEIHAALLDCITIAPQKTQVICKRIS